MTPVAPPVKRPRSPDKDPLPPKSPSRSRKNNVDDDEFDYRFGHLFNTEDYYEDSENNENDYLPNNDEDSDEESIDEVLVHILDKTPNWETTSGIKKFIINDIDRPLPKQFLTDLLDEYAPPEELKEYFAPPKLPNRPFGQKDS